MYVSSFYRPPDTKADYFDQFTESLIKLPKQAEGKPKIIGGDFNLPDISWTENGTENPLSIISKSLLSTIANESLTQLQTEPTRGENILDLYLTNRPGLVKNIQTIPGIGDHNMIIVDTEIKAKINKNKPRKVYRFNKADWTQLKQDASKMTIDLLQNFSSDINTNWTLFKQHLSLLMDKHIPSKMTTTRYNLPWLNSNLKKLTRKKRHTI